MNDDDDVMTIFQDPLLTIIAIVLLSSLWTVIPSPGVSDGEEVTEKTIENLENAIVASRRELRRLDDVERTKKIEAQAFDSSQPDMDTDDVRSRIGALEVLLKSKNKQLKTLEKRLSGIQQKTTITQRAMNKLTRELEEAQKQNTQFEQSFSKKQKKLERLREELKKFREQSQRNTPASLPKNKQHGFNVYSRNLAKGKQPISFVVARHRVFIWDEKTIRSNYHIRRGVGKRHGKMVQYAALTLKGSIRGETVTEIENARSAYQKVLKANNPEKSYIVFKLHNDSFQLFYKARSIAASLGYASDWDPRDKEKIICLAPESVCRQTSGGARMATQ